MLVAETIFSLLKPKHFSTITAILRLLQVGTVIVLTILMIRAMSYLYRLLAAEGAF